MNKKDKQVLQSTSSNSKSKEYFEAMTNTLLSIYDQIILADQHGNILSIYGQLPELWGNDAASLLHQNLIEVESDYFYDHHDMKKLLESKDQTIIKTSWNNHQYIFHKWEHKSDLTTWTVKDISKSTEQTQLMIPESSKEDNHIPFIIKNRKMKDIIAVMKMVSQVSTTVLLLGDSGVGKEVVAKSIHDMGTRKDKPFIAVNCGAIPENLLESELFGYVEGAFSGAKKDGAKGKFEQADGGVLFLDEIAEMPLHLQVKLLRVLQEKQITPLGGTVSKKIDIQIITATNKSLSDMVLKGTFREDLYYRINVVPINIPTLGERKDEIPLLIEFFQNKFNALHQKQVSIGADAVDLLTINDWPGNIRQLENVIERIIVTSTEEVVSANQVQDIIGYEDKQITAAPIFNHLIPLPDAVALVEEQLINMAVEKYGSMKLAAKALEISQPTMSRKYRAIQNKRDGEVHTSLNRRKTLEEQLDSRLRSVAIAASSIIKPEEVMAVIKDGSLSNPEFTKLENSLTTIIKQEGSIMWTFIFEVLPGNQFKTLVADENFVMKPGDIYDGPEAIMCVAKKALEGSVTVSPVYQDVFGFWKTTFAPIIDHSNQVIALLGFDYSEHYINAELSKLARLLQINL